MDVAWKVGPGSEINDWELRMSLRSFRTNFIDRGVFWVIGHIPSWLDTEMVNCIVWPDPYLHCKDANLIHKALRLSMQSDLSDPFIFCSDDQLLLRPSDKQSFKLWHKGEIARGPTDHMGKWEKRLVNTGKILRAAGFSAMHFDCHLPYPLKKEWVREALRFDFSSKPGMCAQSTIINCSVELGEAIKKRQVCVWFGQSEMSEGHIDQLLGVCQFASLNNESVKNPTILDKIESLFPIPAPWELDGSVWKKRSED